MVTITPVAYLGGASTPLPHPMRGCMVLPSPLPLAPGPGPEPVSAPAALAAAGTEGAAAVALPPNKSGKPLVPQQLA